MHNPHRVLHLAVVRIEFPKRFSPARRRLAGRLRLKSSSASSSRASRCWGLACQELLQSFAASLAYRFAAPSGTAAASYSARSRCSLEQPRGLFVPLLQLRRDVAAGHRSSARSCSRSRRSTASGSKDAAINAPRANARSRQVSLQHLRSNQIAMPAGNARIQRVQRPSAVPAGDCSKSLDRATRASPGPSNGFAGRNCSAASELGCPDRFAQPNVAPQLQGGAVEGIELHGHLRKPQGLRAVRPPHRPSRPGDSIAGRSTACRTGSSCRRRCSAGAGNSQAAFCPSWHVPGS